MSVKQNFLVAGFLVRPAGFFSWYNFFMLIRGLEQFTFRALNEYYKPVLTTTFLKQPPVLNDYVVVLP